MSRSETNRLVQSQEMLHLDRPMVLVPLEEYESLLWRASRPSKARRSRSIPSSPARLLRLLRKIRREKGRSFASPEAFQRYLADL